jgi:hypothetical protein
VKPPLSIQAKSKLKVIMNFDCERWRIQDELWEMTGNECKDEEDDDSIVLSSRAKTAPKYKQRAPQDVG